MEGCNYSLSQIVEIYMASLTMMMSPLAIFCCSAVSWEDQFVVLCGLNQSFPAWIDNVYMLRRARPSKADDWLHSSKVKRSLIPIGWFYLEVAPRVCPDG